MTAVENDCNDEFLLDHLLEQHESLVDTVVALQVTKNRLDTYPMSRVVQVDKVLRLGFLDTCWRTLIMFSYVGRWDLSSLGALLSSSPSVVALLSNVYYFIFSRAGAMGDIRKAIDRAEEAMEATRTDDPAYASCLRNLIVILIKKYECTSSLAYGGSARRPTVPCSPTSTSKPSEGLHRVAKSNKVLNVSSLIGLSVTPSGSGSLAPSTPGSKRKISPSAETSSPKHISVLVTPSKQPSNVSPGAAFSTQPLFAPKQLFPHGEAKIARQYTHSHPPPPPWRQDGEKDAIWHKKHVLLLYNLRDLSINIHTEEIQKLLCSIFPGAYNVARARSHLIFQLSRWPSPPWPLTVGGLPITLVIRDVLTAEGRAFIFPRQIFGNGSIPICSEAHYTNAATFSDALLCRLRSDINAYFLKHAPPGVRMLELIHTCERAFYVVLDDHPGAPPAVFSTTSGVLVQNAAGDTFMTSASHGIGEGGTVWHADRPDRTISETVVEIPFTDVSLLKLKDDVVFVNKIFETDAGAVPQFTRLKTSTDELSYGSLCYLNSPYTGNMDAVLVANSIRYFETSPYLTESQLAYNLYNWSYTGQKEGNEGKFQPPDGTCGSVIWNDEGVITGFYHYHIEDGPWAGFALSASASAVVDAGYSLAK
ncbi:hypothetical protein B0T26DRAFT_805084 [Lasiosphaeria miniovina]|uniref:Uncharacterized protein n=1 Tax=Lasiosphaeria miniovina TaxID=1954250 RepID=A0AA40A4U1_9PEZI|nr:uncharacterized protein B0T26DRAFT_805084 [Lasiosphaeria miniovina]KAK0709346.1 hypothetical protein B0T26DRAFT_805084 [Lasiosphaeria miniovina]